MATESKWKPCAGSIGRAPHMQYVGSTLYEGRCRWCNLGAAKLGVALGLDLSAEMVKGVLDELANARLDAQEEAKETGRVVREYSDRLAEAQAAVANRFFG